MSDRQNHKLTSVVSYPDRGAGGNNKYRGNCSPKLIEDLIAHFGVEEICDYMCGSGTTGDVAKAMGIKSHTYDLHSGFDLLNHDIPERSEFTFWHPPYWSIITYSDVMYSAAAVQKKYGYDPRLTDLSRIPTWEGFVRAMNFCLMKQFCALDKGGRMAVLVGDIKKRGKLYSMLFDMVKPGTLENVIIKTQHNCFSDNTQYSGRFIPILHEYVLLIRKDAPLLFPVMLSETKEMDMRDMAGATWRDIVAGVLEECSGAVPVEEIYRRVEGYKRAQTNKWWKEKVRQTLQIYPDTFEKTQRGVWQLRRAA